jgi:hypothetical protein
MGAEGLLIPAEAMAPGTPNSSGPFSPNRSSNSMACLPDRFIPRRKDSPHLHLSLFAQKASASPAKTSNANTTVGDTNDADTSPAKQDYRNALKVNILKSTQCGDFVRDRGADL